GSYGHEQISVGAPTNVSSQWIGNCKQRMTDILDSAVNAIESIYNLAKSFNASYKNETQERQLQDMKDAVNLLKSTLECMYSEEGDKGTLAIRYKLSFDDVNKLKNLAQTGGQSEFSLARSGDTITFQQKYDVVSAQQKEVRVRVHGSVQSIEPTGYAMEGSDYVYSSPQSLSYKTLKIVYKGTGGAAYTTSTNNPTTTLQSSAPPTGYDNQYIIYLVIAIVAVIIGVVLYIFLKKPPEEPQPVGGMPAAYSQQPPQTGQRSW
ncbi:hypothetical protein HZC09_02830, partial [Candidatus Micrarchaeota archaeon]|nr:hypothetical protein [Candidatus Micrarchaeota archaeon]